MSVWIRRAVSTMCAGALRRTLSLVILLSSIALGSSVLIATAQSLPSNPPAAGAKSASTIAIDPAQSSTVQDGSTQVIDLSKPYALAAFQAQSKNAYDLTLLATGIAALFLTFFCLMYLTGYATNEFSKHYIVIVVIMAAIFLLVMGYSEQQIAPAYGLLGTILGYIFGKAVGEADARASAAIAGAAAQGQPQGSGASSSPQSSPSPGQPSGGKPVVPTQTTGSTSSTSAPAPTIVPPSAKETPAKKRSDPTISLKKTAPDTSGKAP